MGCNDKMCDMNMDCMHCDKANCTLRKYDYDKNGKRCGSYGACTVKKGE